MRLGAGWYGSFRPASQGDRLEYVKNLQLKRRLFQSELQMMKTADPECGISEEQVAEMELRVEEVSEDMNATMGGSTYATEKEVLSALSHMMEIQEEKAGKKLQESKRMPDLDTYEPEGIREPEEMQE